MKGPRNASTITIYGSGYNIFTNNCGETNCRIAERLNLPTNNSFTPWGHQDYVENSWQQFIKRQQRLTPLIPRNFQVPPIPTSAPTPVN